MNISNLNPFKVTTISREFVCKGRKRWFKVITADGKEYETTRTDYINHSWYWVVTPKAKVKYIGSIKRGIKTVGIYLETITRK